MGSATAFQLLEKNKNLSCLLIDQFSLVHTNGSSHGDSRIIRRSYNEPHFANLLLDAYKSWNTIEQNYNQQFIVQTGGLDFGLEHSSEMKKVEDTLKSQNLDYETLNYQDVHNRFPAFNLDKNYYGLYQADAGILLASKALNFFQQTAIHRGLEVATGESVSHLKEENDHIVVSTKSKTFKTQKVVICAGSWINGFFKNFSINHRTKVLPVNYGYFKVLKPDLFKVGRFPIFIAWGDKTFYGFGSLEREGYFKVGAHYSYIEKEFRDETLTKLMDKKLTTDLVSFIGNVFPDVDSTEAIFDSCFYTMNDNENFILEFHPDNSKIIFGGGFSGHGFKFSPLIGTILSDLALLGKTSFDIAKFRFSHF